MTTFVKARRRTRRYDKERGCYVYDISFKTQAPLTERTIDVAEAFGIGVDEEHEHVLYRDFELKLAMGDVVYITGDSGSGKSVLLKAIKDDLGDEAAYMDELDAPKDASIIDTVGGSFSEGLMLLSMVGLNDAYLFLRRYGELSDGQRYRYRIARLIDQGKQYWLCDEFCSTLDRTTAKIVSYSLQKHARRTGATLIVATTHKDLALDLNPSVHIVKGWGREKEIKYTSNPTPRPCNVTKDATIRESTRDEYMQLGYLHYRDHKPPVPYKFYALDINNDLAGVIAYSYSPVMAKGRKKAIGYAPKLDELNRDWTTISRVIVHPKYRGTGLGSKLVKETLPLQGRRHVELVAVMAQYNPFAEKAGMKRILIKESHQSITRALDQLKELGFNSSLLGSESNNRRKLQELDAMEMETLRSILKKVSSQYYRRLSRQSRPYVRKQEYIDWLDEQDEMGLSKTLKTLSVLAQSKVYLYWCMDWEDEQ